MVYFILCRQTHHVQQMEFALIPPKYFHQGEGEVHWAITGLLDELFVLCVG